MARLWLCILAALAMRLVVAQDVSSTGRTVQCFADPCSVNKCPEGSRCVSSYNGGCRHHCVPDGSGPSGWPQPGGGGGSCGACNLACKQGYRCAMNPSTCKPSCKPSGNDGLPSDLPGGLPSDLTSYSLSPRRRALLQDTPTDTSAQGSTDDASTTDASVLNIRRRGAGSFGYQPVVTLPGVVNNLPERAGGSCTNAPGSCAVIRCASGYRCKNGANCRGSCVPTGSHGE